MVALLVALVAELAGPLDELDKLIAELAGPLAEVAWVIVELVAEQDLGSESWYIILLGFKDIDNSLDSLSI